VGAIRRFRIEDLQRVVTIEKQSFGEFAWPASDFRDLAREPLFLVALNGDIIAGYSITQVRNGHAELISVATSPRYRGLGIGLRLLERSLRAAVKLDARRFGLMVKIDNHQAIRLYRRLGFVRVRTVPRYYEDGAGGWRMLLELTTPSLASTTDTRRRDP